MTITLLMIEMVEGSGGMIFPLNVWLAAHCSVDPWWGGGDSALQLCFLLLLRDIPLFLFMLFSRENSWEAGY